jgi:hypothetical protein
MFSPVIQRENCIMANVYFDSKILILLEGGAQKIAEYQFSVLRPPQGFERQNGTYSDTYTVRNKFE